MADFDMNERDRDEIFSKAVRAGKRTYFFDVKSTKGKDYYLTITESKKRFADDKAFYEKHKLFLYKEDFDKFIEGLKETIDYIQAIKDGMEPEPVSTPAVEATSSEDPTEKYNFTISEEEFDAADR